MSKSTKVFRRRRTIALIIIGLIIFGAIWWQASQAPNPEPVVNDTTTEVDNNNSDQPLAVEALGKLAVRESAPRTGYSRDQFGKGWAKWQKCDTRQRILARDLVNVKMGDDGCTVLSGLLHDPYTGKDINFMRGVETSSAVQIDHIVALSNAWQTGAQDLSAETRTNLANDDLELIAADGKANMQKSDSDAANWLPTNKAFDCQYVARQIAVKIKYTLWVTSVEHDAMSNTLKTCPNEHLPAP